MEFWLKQTNNKHVINVISYIAWYHAVLVKRGVWDNTEFTQWENLLDQTARYGLVSSVIQKSLYSCGVACVYTQQDTYTHIGTWALPLCESGLPRPIKESERCN